LCHTGGKPTFKGGSLSQNPGASRIGSPGPIYYYILRKLEGYATGIAIDLLADATISEASKDDVSELVHNVELLVSNAGRWFRLNTSDLRRQFGICLFGSPIEKPANQFRNFLAIFFQSEVTCVEQVKLKVL
jgi:hypothetical protein